MTSRPLTSKLRRSAVLTVFAVGLMGLPALAGTSVAAGPPIVTIASPTVGSEVAGPTVVTFDATSDAGITSITACPRSGLTGTCIAYTPAEASCSVAGTACSISIDFTGSPEGPGQVYLYAVDGNGISTDVYRDVVINNNLSSAVLYAPSEGAVLAGVADLQAAATGGATLVDFYVDGVRLADTSTHDSSGLRHQAWDTRRWVNGTHIIAVGGNDGGHDAPGTPITVTVHNPLPVTTTVSANRTVIPAPVAVTFSARLRVTGTVTPVVGKTVTFTGRTETGTTIYLGTAITNAAGVATKAVRLAAPARITAASAGNPDTAASSGAVLVRATRSIKLTSSATTVRRGVLFTLTVKAGPARTTAFALQYHVGTAWRTFGTGTTTSRGSWSHKFYFSARGYEYLRAVVMVSSWRTAATSANVRITVR